MKKEHLVKLCCLWKRNMHRLKNSPTNALALTADSKWRWMDNVFIKRLWWSVKYEEVYLKAYCSIAEARRAIENYFELYNYPRRHQSLDERTPDAVHWATMPKKEAAA